MGAVPGADIRTTSPGLVRTDPSWLRWRTGIDSFRQEVGAFFLDVTQAVDAAFSDHQNHKADP